MTCVIRCMGIAGMPGGPIGQFLMGFDVDANQGRGSDSWCFSARGAMHFPDAAAAMAAWKTQSTRFPTRTDGRPNRPLTAYSIEIVEIEA